MLTVTSLAAGVEDEDGVGGVRDDGLRAVQLEVGGEQVGVLDPWSTAWIPSSVSVRSMSGGRPGRGTRGSARPA